MIVGVGHIANQILIDLSVEGQTLIFNKTPDVQTSLDATIVQI